LKQNKKAKVHIKLDTGMSRIGFQTDEASIGQIKEICKLQGLEVEGYSHILQKRTKKTAVPLISSFKALQML